jgi:hypothetical protein
VAQIPLDVLTTEVSGRFLHAAKDGKDLDRDPDGTPWIGLTITFEATVPSVRNLRSDPAALITLDPIVVRTDSNGDLVGDDAEPSIVLVASDDPELVPTGSWYYVATVEGDGFPTTRIPFVANGGKTFDLVRDPRIPLDLDAVLPEYLKAVQQMRDLIASFEGTAIAVLDD